MNKRAVVGMLIGFAFYAFMVAIGQITVTSLTGGSAIPHLIGWAIPFGVLGIVCNMLSRK